MRLEQRGWRPLGCHHFYTQSAGALVDGMCAHGHVGVANRGLPATPHIELSKATVPVVHLCKVHLLTRRACAVTMVT